MKKLVFLAFSFLLFNCTINAQIIVTPINKYYTCCGELGVLNPEHSTLIDLNNDTVNDINFFSDSNPAIWSQGFYCSVGAGNPLSKYQITLDVVKLGDIITLPNSYGSFGYSAEYYSQADYWPVNGGFRFMGIRNISLADTNYGWIKLEYLNFPNAPIYDMWLDTIRIVEYAINAKPNEPLVAGQLWATEVNNFNQKTDAIEIFPNPARNVLFIKSENKEQRKLYNSVGELLFVTDKNEIYVGKYGGGLYYIKIGNRVRKVIIE